MAQNEGNDLFKNLQNLEKLLQRETRKEAKLQMQQQKKNNHGNNQNRENPPQDRKRASRASSKFGKKTNRTTINTQKKQQLNTANSNVVGNSPNPKDRMLRPQRVPRKLYNTNGQKATKADNPIIPPKYSSKRQSNNLNSEQTLNSQKLRKKASPQNQKKKGSPTNYLQLGIQCKYFIKWMKRCTESINTRQNLIADQINTKVSQEAPYTDDTNEVISAINRPNVETQNIQSNDLETNSADETYHIDLEETSPLPKGTDMKPIPSIRESDFHNPNSDDFHYNSYDVSEKSLSLLPPQGEGEVTEFHPSKLQ